MIYGLPHWRTDRQPDRQTTTRRFFAQNFRQGRARVLLRSFFTLPPPPPSSRSRRRRKLFPDDDYDDDGCIMPRCGTRSVSATGEGGAEGRFYLVADIPAKGWEEL